MFKSLKVVFFIVAKHLLCYKTPAILHKNRT
jgi:hypothetical protein